MKNLTTEYLASVIVYAELNGKKNGYRNPTHIWDDLSDENKADYIRIAKAVKKAMEVD